MHLGQTVPKEVHGSAIFSYSILKVPSPRCSMTIHGDHKGAIAYDMKTLDMIRQYARVLVDPKEPPAKQQKTTVVAPTTPATPKRKDMSRDLESSKEAAARAMALAPPAQEPVATASESHEEDDEMANAPDSTPQAKET